MTVPNVAIILVNWNGKDDTLECLASLSRDTYPNKQIIVVDNGSADGSAAVVREQFPRVTILETGSNLGFTGGNNVGIRYALERQADYVFLLNNDTSVEPGAVTALVTAAEAHCEFGLLTPVIHYFDSPGEVWFAGSYINLARGVAVHDNSRVPSLDDAPRAIPWASGCAMLMHSKLMRRLGGFDERYFLNWEDVDLSLRTRELGCQIAIVPSARIYHKVGRSFALSGTGLYYHVRNNLLLVSLHGGRAAGRAALYVICQKLAGAVRDIRRHPVRSRASVKHILCAIRDHFRRQYGRLPGPRS